MHKNVANFSMLLIFTLTEIIDRKFENQKRFKYRWFVLRLWKSSLGDIEIDEEVVDLWFKNRETQAYRICITVIKDGPNDVFFC